MRVKKLGAGPRMHHGGPAGTLLSNPFTCRALMLNLSPPLPRPSSPQEVKLGAEESRALRTRIQLAEAAQKQARGMEMDYEEVIHLLEAEIAELKAQRAEQPAPTNKVTDRRPGDAVGPTGADLVQSLS